MNEPGVIFEDELGAFDYLMLKGESNPHTRSSMLSIFLLDQTPGIDNIKEVLERASREFIRLRQYVVIPSLPVASPRWVVDPDFDIEHHFKHLSVPAPGTLNQILEIGEKILSASIDLAKPLWEAVLVEGVNVEGCEAALIMKLHHSVTDGVGGLQLFKSLYDFERNPDRGPMPALPIPEDITATDLVKQGLASSMMKFLPGLAKQAKNYAQWGLEALNQPEKVYDELLEKTASAKRTILESPAPLSPLLRCRGLSRRLDAFEFPLAELRKVTKANGVSVNDGYIAAICGGLRRYHETKGTPIDTLPLAMPVNLRKDDDLTAGNRFAGARIAAPVGEKDPVKRMKLIREIVLEAVGEPALDLLNSIAPIFSHLPTAFLNSMASSINIDVQASNVPGFPGEPYIAGSKVVSLYPFGPLPGAAMMICMSSQAGQCYVGIHYDTASVTDPELFHRSMQEGFNEILQLGNKNVASPRRKPRTTTAKKPTSSKSNSRKPRTTQKAES